MRLAVTGFVSGQAGSVASANALLLRQLLNLGHEVDFFSKSAFVDPRPIVGDHPAFRFTDVTNLRADRLRRRVERRTGVGSAAAQFDSWTYNRMLARVITDEQRTRNYSTCLWLGDYARGTVPGVPTVSFAQGPPGTDARAVLKRRKEVRELAGRSQAWKWTALALVRLSHMGLPAFRHSDHIVVGSHQSCQTLQQRYGIDPSRLSAMPYPIDLELFKEQSGEREVKSGNQPLRVLWLGRIVPRKRLDLFLDGVALAIQQGNDVRLSIVGSVGFVEGYERLIAEFPFPDRLEWSTKVARSEVPALLRRHDVLAQPSDEENFGSSVAEAQACGLPVIVGQTNGNADYLCSRDIHLRDDRTETFAAAVSEMITRKAKGRWGLASESRGLAEKQFQLKHVAAQLTGILESASRGAHTAG